MAYPELFQKCVKVILKNEGGYINHPSDPGGETNMGIAKRFYPNLDIKNLTKEQATEIYYKDYWLPMNLEKIHNEDLVLQVFDFGVNAGIRRSIKMLQKMVGLGSDSQDGMIGPITIYFVNNYNGDVVDSFKKRRRIYYMDLAARKSELEVFLKGWLNRIEKTKF
jgi:lysozyme family protein